MILICVCGLSCLSCVMWVGVSLVSDVILSSFMVCMILLWRIVMVWLILVCLLVMRL